MAFIPGLQVKGPINMLSRLTILLMTITILGSAKAVATNEVHFYVSPSGSDTNPGTLEQPFATIPQAQGAARRHAGKNPVYVNLREGTYYLSSPLMMTSSDSGTQAAPVVYQAHGQEHPVVSGGVLLKNLAWRPYQDGIQMASVPTGFTTDQLFVNGQLQPLARYPNFNPEERHFNGWAKDAISPQRAKRWKDPTGGFIHALHSSEWGGMHYRITGKSDDNRISFEGGWQNNRPAGMHEIRFVENLFEELDAPGEWFLDSNKNILYFYPPPGLDLAHATVEGVQHRHLLEFQGNEKEPIHHLTIKGITFRHASRTFMENKEPLVRSDWTTYRGAAILYNGAEDCTLENCFIDQVGGNAVFVNNYNRRITIRGCHIARAGGNGVAFVGDRNAARVPRDWKDRSQTFANLDRTPGPRTNNYPADCLVEDCLIYLTGRVEKQTSPVQIELSQGITVRHCSLYDVPRAGINIGDGCWGGHIIEFCDIFDTVKETGDHGSFNSWGRDRFWDLPGIDLNDDKSWAAHKDIVYLDAIKTTILRNNRWRCDHGWDIDLDDGSSKYHIYNNLLLHGGLKNREGFGRIVENNIILNNGFHPHVWYKHGGDIVRRNIMMSDHYLPAGGMPASPWGQEMDYNLVHRPGSIGTRPATALAAQSRRDEHSILADAQFIDPARGDFRVKDDSPAIKLGFVNFPMDQFGVQRPELKKIARMPVIPTFKQEAKPEQVTPSVHYIWQAKARDIHGLGDRSAFGLPDESGVLLVDVPETSFMARAGLQKDDVIVTCNGTAVKTLKDLDAQRDKAAGQKLSLGLIRKQQPTRVELTSYAYLVTEARPDVAFKTIPLADSSAVLAAKISAGGAPTNNDPISSLLDGKIGNGYGPVYANGVTQGMYKLDLNAITSIVQINTYSSGGNRARQKFVLYGSNSTEDPGWNLADTRRFTPMISVDVPQSTSYQATSVRQSNGQPLGDYRWLIWKVVPINSIGENTSFQEMQIKPYKP